MNGAGLIQFPFKLVIELCWWNCNFFFYVVTIVAVDFMCLTKIAKQVQGCKEFCIASLDLNYIIYCL